MAVLAAAVTSAIQVQAPHVDTVSRSSELAKESLYSGPQCAAIRDGIDAVLITSTGEAGYKTRRPEKNIWAHGVPSTPLWVFHENSWDVKHGRTGVDFRNKPEVACSTDVFDAQPWLWKAIEHDGTLDEFYQYAGDMEPCDQPLRIKSGKVCSVSHPWHTSLPPPHPAPRHAPHVAGSRTQGRVYSSRHLSCT